MGFQAAESLSEQIAQHLGQRIIRGLLKPKERVQELKIAGELQVSRGSVREALLILERRHLVNIYPRKGAIVADLSRNDVVALYDLYVCLLTMLAKKVAEKAAPPQLSSLKNQVAKVSAIVAGENPSPEKVMDAGFELMAMCYPIVHNPYLEETLENCRPAISRTYFISMARRQRDLQTTVVFFEELVESVLERDQPRIASVISAYGERQLDLVLEELVSRAGEAAIAG